MNNILMTEEFKKKKDYKGTILIGIILAILVAISFMIYSYINKRQEKKKESKVEEVTLNSELRNLYGFAISDHYIMALKKDGTSFPIYNLLQGTGIYGDFTYYTYNDNKLYLLFSDNNIYTISLTNGNGVYELTKIIGIDSSTCLSGSTGKTSDLVFVGNTIYLNNSSCTLTRIFYNKKEKNPLIQNLKTFQNMGVDLEYSKQNQSIYLNADHTIYQLDIKKKEMTPIINNIITDIPLTIKSNILIYKNIENGIPIFYGYNIKNNQTTKIVENGEELILYKQSFIYKKQNEIHLLNGNKPKKIYTAHYNDLSNIQLINENTLQIIDTDTTDMKKRKIINIDLSSKNYKTTINKKEYKNIVEYTK